MLQPDLIVVTSPSFDGLVTSGKQVYCQGTIQAQKRKPFQGYCAAETDCEMQVTKAHLFLISGRRAPHLRLPTNRFLTARLVRPGSSIEMAFQLLPYLA